MASHKKRILIVDDDVEYVESNKELLESGGYEVLTAHNGNDGLALADHRGTRIGRCIRQRDRACALPARLAHLDFGTVLGEDGRPLKTRSGENVRLKDLLAEAIERSHRLVTEKNPELPENERRTIAQVVGAGSVQYADLSQNRSTDYVFAWDKMITLEGNTAAEPKS